MTTDSQSKPGVRRKVAQKSNWWAGDPDGELRVHIDVTLRGRDARIFRGIGMDGVQQSEAFRIALREANDAQASVRRSNNVAAQMDTQTQQQEEMLGYFHEMAAVYHKLADTHDEHVRVMNATHDQFIDAMKAITGASHRITEMVDRLHEALLAAATLKQEAHAAG